MTTNTEVYSGGYANISVKSNSPDSTTSKDSTQAVLGTPPLQRLAELAVPPANCGPGDSAAGVAKAVQFDATKRPAHNTPRPQRCLRRVTTTPHLKPHSPRPGIGGRSFSPRLTSGRGYKSTTRRFRRLHVPGVVRFNPVIKVHCIPPRSPSSPALGLGIFMDTDVCEPDSSRKWRSCLQKAVTGLRRANVLRGLPAFIQIKTTRLVVVAVGAEYRGREQTIG